MNQIITDNRHKIDTACQLCFRQLMEYCEKSKAYKQEMAKIAASPYIQEEKERQYAAVQAKIGEQVNPIHEEVRSGIDTIHQAAAAIAEIPIDTVDLAAIGTLTGLMGGSLSTNSQAELSDALLEYADKLRGQPKALSIVKVAMERVGLEDPRQLKDKHGNNLIFSVNERISKLERMADHLLNATPNLMYAFDLARELEIFADNMGVQLKESLKEMVNAVNPDDYEDAYFAKMSRLMGLSND